MYVILDIRNMKINVEYIYTRQFIIFFPNMTDCLHLKVFLKFKVF